MQLIDIDKELGVVRQRLTTEEAGLEKLEAINRTLQQDVERFKRLQENKKKLDAHRGEHPA